MSPDLEGYEAQIPALASSHYLVTSDEDPEYNCVAWAAGDDRRHWWPPTHELIAPKPHWPDEAPCEETLDAFVDAFRTLGYEVCANADLEDGLEKVAIYVVEGTTIPTHAARQLPSGNWTSKLNVGIDIEHLELAAVEGGARMSYGQVGQVMSRPRTGEPPSPRRPWPEGRPKGRPWPRSVQMPPERRSR